MDNTNIEGAKAKGSGWKDTDIDEMKAFIGCLLHCGALRQNNLSVEMLFSPVDGNSLARATFGMHRFSNFFNHLRFDDKATRTKRRARVLFASSVMFGIHFTTTWPNIMSQAKTLQ